MTKLWDSREAAALSAGSMCPSTGDRTEIGELLDGCLQAAAGDLHGDGPLEDPFECPVALEECTSTFDQCTSDLEECEADAAGFIAEIETCMAGLEPCLQDRSDCLADYVTCDGYPTGMYPLRTGDTVSRGAGSDGALQRGTARSFTDNGDGTITDHVTGLMWEKKDDSGGIHDKDNQYGWCPTAGNACAGNDWTLTGTIATSFLATLNGGGGFAGHTDWRIPNMNELESLRNLGAMAPAVYSEFHSGCAPGCTVTTCSCTSATFYSWTSTTYDPAIGDAYAMSPWGQIYTSWKYQQFAARAVRTAS